MKSNQFKNYKKQNSIKETLYRRTHLMPNQSIAMVVIFVVLIALLYPTHQVLTIRIRISENVAPAPEDIQIIKENLPLFSYFARQNLRSNVIGDTGVNVVVKNPSNIIVLNETYHLSAGAFIIKTPSQIDTDYTVLISIPKFSYQRSIKIG